MRLEKIEIELFRNFTDAQEMTVEPAVTSLVGKNESGKTTILQALHRLNPANNPDTFTLSTEYPRPRLARDRRKRSLEEVTPVTAWFSLEPSETPQVAEILGFPPPDGTLVEASRSYDDTLRVEVTCPVGSVVRVAGEAVGVNAGDLDELSDLGTVPEVTARAREMAAAHRNVGETAQATALEKLPRQMDKYEVLFDVGTTEQQEGALIELLPKFFYFSDYQMLAGETNLNELAERVASGQLRDGDETMISLLSLAGQEPKSFLDEEYVTRKAELQAASSDLTRQVMKYWKQNDALSVVFDTDMPVVGQTPHGHEIRHRFLKVELHDARHDVTTNFSTRSAGFQWFFSFLAAFSAYQDSGERVVVLLDEPGTSLHGEAQRDFLRYIFDELGAHQQVLYTTHSQHMLDPTRYETMRAVHDRATREHPELGVVITPVDLSADRTTILPVEAALGYTVAQHLFLGHGPHLAVEGSSDFVFLIRMSAHLISLGRTGLDPRISIIPVGGVTNMPAFVALFGRRLDVRALVDGAETTKVSRKIIQAAEAVGVDKSHIVILGDLPGLPSTADIEDLFTIKDYLWLYSRAGQPLSESDLPTTGEPILRRIENIRGKFDHAGPAHQLTKDLDEFLAQVDPATLARFEELFVKLAV
ncbi:AAA family ATPase [Salinispora arenicola]|uniref:AAA family ATPase n=1 Tax=Salinispora arenicola TaxID=168697 RepID=UPI0004806E81|nr:AAA family ATPase [Salinispora arenicola]